MNTLIAQAATQEIKTPEVKIILPEPTVWGMKMTQFYWLMGGMVVFLVALVALLVFLERKHHGLRALFKNN